MTTLTRLRQFTERLQRVLAVLGVTVDLLDVTGADRVANALQVLALLLTAVLVLLVLFTRLATGQVEQLAQFVVSQLLVTGLSLLALLVGLGVVQLHLNSLMDAFLGSEYPIIKNA